MGNEYGKPRARRDRPSKFLRISRWVFASILLLGLAATGLLLAITDGEPRTDPRSAPTALQAGAGRDAVRRLLRSTANSGASSVILSPAHLDGVSALASHGFRPNRLDMYSMDSVLYLDASHKLPIGRWLNVNAEVRTAKSGFPPVRLTIGPVAFSPYLSRVLLNIGRWGAGVLGTDLPPLDVMVQKFDFHGDKLVALLDLPERTNLISRFLNTQSSHDPALVIAAYCRLTAAQEADPQNDLAIHVRRAFANKRDEQATSQANSAAFIALAMAIVDKRVGSLVGIKDAQIAGCKMPLLPILLHGRGDLPMHWSLSAALSVSSGTQFAHSIGEWKELADSAPVRSPFQQGSPTGFSFVDLSADRSGFRVAEMAVDPARAKIMAKRLSRATQEEILPPSLLAMEEGLSENFIEQYGGIDDARFLQTLSQIDRILNERGLVRPTTDASIPSK